MTYSDFGNQTLTSNGLAGVSLHLLQGFHHFASPKTNINKIYFQSFNMKASKKSNYWLLEAKDKRKEREWKKIGYCVDSLMFRIS